MSLPPGRPKKGSVPPGGTAPSAREPIPLPAGRPKEGSVPLGGTARAARERIRPSASAFLAGATSRLLPASIPLRYFGAAVVYHVLAWLALLVGADAVPTFAGGLGWPLAALHLVTMGVLVMTALGASLQLLPVATRQPVHWQHAPAAVWWLFTPGVAATTLGMGIPALPLLVSGTLLVTVALVIYALLLARNLIGARGMPVVVAHGWVALCSLAVVVVTALSLVAAYTGAPGLARGTALALHVAFAGYGFMGMLALGLSYIVVPMFALSATPDPRKALASCALAIVALALAGAAAFGISPPGLRIVAIAAGAMAVGLHLHLMNAALRTGMRRELGRSFKLVRASWVFLAVSLIAGLAVALDAPVAGISALFGLTLIGGWLLTFLLGILQRIVPFLASMHAGPGEGRAPTPSKLTSDRPLAIHFYCHFAALAILALAVVVDSAWLAWAAALTGMVGAGAFAAFFVIVQQRMWHAAGSSRVPRAA